MSYPPPYYNSPPTARINGFAIASLVLGILSIMWFWIPFMGFIAAVLSIIFGLIGRSKAKQDYSGRSLSIWGTALGSFGLFLNLAFWIGAILLAANSDPNIFNTPFPTIS